MHSAAKIEIIAISPFLFQYPSNGFCSRLASSACLQSFAVSKVLSTDHSDIWGFDIETADAAAAVEHFDHTGIGFVGGGRIIDQPAAAIATKEPSGV